MRQIVDYVGTVVLTHPSIPVCSKKTSDIMFGTYTTFSNYMNVIDILQSSNDRSLLVESLSLVVSIYNRRLKKIYEFGEE